MDYPHPSRRTGLGRRFADIVAPSGRTETSDLGRLLGGPAVVPLEAVPLAMLVADRSGRVRATNARWRNLSGLDATASLGSGWLAAIREEERAALQAAVDQLAAGGPPRRLRGRWRAGLAGAANISLSSVELAGEILVGIIVEPGPADSAPLAKPPGPAREDVVSLLRSLEALMATLDRVVARLQPGIPGPAPANRPRTARTSAACAG